MSEENSEIDEIDFNSEIESAETISNGSFSPSRFQDANVNNFELTESSNIIQNLIRREIGFGCSKPAKQILRSYHLRNVFPIQVLRTHVFMGMTKCGTFLMTYTMTTDQDDDEWYATVYKYRLHWWTFKPGSQVRKIAEVSLFGNHKIVTPVQMYICQWPQDYEKILVYGLLKECGSIDVTAPSNNQHAFVTVTALPSLNSCQECRVVASSYMLDDIAASWDTCLRFSCLKHGYTVHTSFDVVVPYPEFAPKISLKCHDYAVFNTNNFLYALRIKLENCERKPKDEQEDLPYGLNCTADYEESKSDDSLFPTCSKTSDIVEQKKVLNIKEQIIRDFSEEINLNPKKVHKESAENESKDRFLALDVSITEDGKNNMNAVTNECLMSPPLPTRITHLENSHKSFSNQNFDRKMEQKANISESNKEDSGKKEECSDKDCFRCPKSSLILKSNVKRDVSKKAEQRTRTEIRKNNSFDDCSKKYYKSFFTRHKVSRNIGVIIRNNSFGKPILKPVKSNSDSDIHSNLESRSIRFNQSRISENNADTTYEFVDDTQHEVEKLSLFRKKRLADKKYEFQDFDSENIVPFSIVRQENTLRSPRKSTESENDEAEIENANSGDKTEIMLRSPSPRYLDLSVSVPSPRSPLILEILSSPTNHESVLRPFNRNTNGNQLLSPMAKYLPSPPPSAQRVKACSKKGCDDVTKISKAQQGANNKTSTNLDTRLILENGIIINDISEGYFKDGVDIIDPEVYQNLFRCSNKFHGEAVRFERRFVEVDDELVSVITDIEDDDMSAVTGYHTALNVEVHGAGYAQLQMISNSKAEKLSAPCVVIDQQTLDIEAVCHSVAAALCHVHNKTFTFCNDYDIEVLDVCPRTGDVLILLMMRIEGAEGIKDEVSQLQQYEASVTLVWNLHSGHYKVCMVVPPQTVNWVWDYNAIWNPAKEASRRFLMQLPADVTLCEPSVRVTANLATLRGVSLSRIQDVENGIQFVL